jgi:hypothetical protein
MKSNHPEEAQKKLNEVKSMYPEERFEELLESFKD